MPTETLELDYALALDHGQRPYQEDAVLVEFGGNGGLGLAVLADGMGGHAAGDVASRLTVTTVLDHLKKSLSKPKQLEKKIIPALREAAEKANAEIHAHGKADQNTAGMGATLLTTVFHQNHLRWLSIGDSPLYLYRDGALKQLNQDHSLGRQLDNLVKLGMIEQEMADNHPDRFVLTSALTGDEIARIDCPEEPFPIVPGDVLVLASDGLQYLKDDAIEAVLGAHKDASAPAICRALMQAVDELDHPHQDNVSIVVVRP